MSRHVVLACEVLRPELELLAAAMEHAPEVRFLQQGLHDTPNQLREQVQAAVDDSEQSLAPERLVLGYGLCGRGLTGVHSRTCTLVIPKVHDCIPLLLGQKQDVCGAYSQGGSTFWMSPGWLGCSQLTFIRHREARRAEYTARFDADAADYLIDMEASWLASYKRAALIRWDGVMSRSTLDACMQEARTVAADAGLPYAEEPGNPSYLKALLCGGNDGERFFQLTPGQSIDIGPDGQLHVVVDRTKEPS